MSKSPSPDDLLARIAAMQGQSLLIFADLVVDRFLYGTPKRVSREAPVVILEHDREDMRPGGGANTVANLASLGGKPQLIGSIGDDEPGKAVLALLNEQGVSSERVQKRQGWSTPSKTRILGGAPNTVKQQIIRYDVGEPLTLSQENVEELVAIGAAAAKELAAAPLVVVFSDYGYGSVTPQLAALLKQRLPEDTLTLVDSRYDLASFTGLSGATPNQEEAEALVGGSLSTPERLIEKGDTLFRMLDADFVLVTRGSEGMALFEDSAFEDSAPGRRVCFLPVAGSQEVTDVTGAGDTVIGTFALALAAGSTPLEAACLANYAGGLAVMKAGTATVSPAELVAAVRNNQTPIESLTFVEL